MKSGPTIKDIAREVGVTSATVSYVLSQNPRQSISAATREKVLKAATQLGYVPNGAAKVVRGAPSWCVGLAIEKNLGTARFNLVMQGARAALEEKGYNLMLCSFERRHGVYPDYVNNALERRVDGIIFVGKDNEGPSAECEALIARHQIPFVAYDCGAQNKPYSTVELAYEESAFALASRLLAEGAKTLYYICPQLSNHQENCREAGVRRAMQAYPGRTLRISRMPLTLEQLHQVERMMGSENPAQAVLSIDRFLNETVAPSLSDMTPKDALIFSWGVYASAGWLLLRRAGLSARLAALSDVGVPSILSGQVLCCQFPGIQAGQECARLLLQQLEGEKSVQSRVLPLSLGSTQATE